MINLLGPIQLLSQQDRETLERAARLLLRYEQTRPLVVPKIHSFTNQKQFSSQLQVSQLASLQQRRKSRSL
jgi:hypothetical protein